MMRRSSLFSRRPCDFVIPWKEGAGQETRTTAGRETGATSRETGATSRFRNHAAAILDAGIASMLVLALVSGCHSYQIDATIENRTGAPVQLLEVDYPSASFGVDSLAAGAVYHYRFQVRGGGPISIQYTDPSGHLAHISGPTLAEGQHGQLQIVLLPEAKAAFTAQLSPVP